jgi:Cu/Ag efflux protein CusF
MHLIKNQTLYKLGATLTMAVGLAGAAMAQPTAAGKPDAQLAASAADMTDGEVRKVDKSSKKITIKHGEIKSLDMPGMTMVFQVKDPAMLDMVKTGDKVRFKVEKADGAIVVTEIQAAK